MSKKFLLAITHSTGLCNNSNNSCIFLVKAWRRFLENSKINDIDVIFVNDGFEKEFFETNCAPYKQLVVQIKKEPKIGLAHANIQHQIYQYAISEGYSDILRFDGDSFPSKETIEILRSAIVEKNYLLTTSCNGKSSVWLKTTEATIDLSANQFCGAAYRAHDWMPWRLPTLSAAFDHINVEFLKDVLKDYETYFGETTYVPTATNFMKYGEVCKVLGEEPIYDLEASIHFDGPIKSDLWTFIAARKPKTAGVVSKNNRSFNCRIQAGCFGSLFGKDARLEDDGEQSLAPDIVVERIQAPFTHIGMSYMFEMHFDTKAECALVNRNEYNNSFVNGSEASKGFGALAAQHAIIKMLTAGAPELEVVLEKTLQIAGIHRTDYDLFYDVITKTFFADLEAYCMP